MRCTLEGGDAGIPEAAALGRWKGGWPGRELGLVFVPRLVQSGRLLHDPGSVEVKDLGDDLFSTVPRPAFAHPCLPEGKLDLERCSNRRTCNSSRGSTPSVWLRRTLFLHSGANLAAWLASLGRERQLCRFAFFEEDLSKVFQKNLFKNQRARLGSHRQVTVRKARTPRRVAAEPTFVRTLADTR